MKLSLIRLKLPLAHEFRISRESITHQQSLIVQLNHHGSVGYGEVTENRFYGHTFDSITESVRKAEPFLQRYISERPADLWEDLMATVDGDTFAASAIDMAAHDLHARRQGIPVWKDWGLKWNEIPDSSFTIGIDTIEIMVQKLQEMAGWKVYKIKLGTPQDIEIVRELRRHTDARFRVDANCGWNADQTIQNSKQLKELGVEFIEQPLPVQSSLEDKLRVFLESAVPVIADEDCQVIADVENCFPLYHGVNVKICKCGGLTPALRMLRMARELGMKTMIGCMVESSIGISGAAQLLPLLDYADLDGAVLLRDEPATGVRLNCGRIQMPDVHGCGASLNWDRLPEFQPAEPTHPCNETPPDGEGI